MQKEEIIMLTEALDTAGYKILYFEWKEYCSPGDPYFGETIDLKILKKPPKKEKSSNPV